MKHFYLITTSLILFQCGQSQKEQATAQDLPHVILIVVDTLRADHMSSFGYERLTTPELDAYFKDGVFFDQAYAPISFTPPSMMSMLSGRHPMNHRVRMAYQKLPDNIPILSDVLGAHGYQTSAVVSNMVLSNEATGIGKRFDYYDDFVDEKVPVRNNYERNAARTTDAAIEWLKKAEGVNRPHFFWLHFMDPHGPYQAPLQTFQSESSIPINVNRIPKYNRLPDGDGLLEDGQAYIDAYDNEIVYLDQELGRFFTALENSNLKNSIVIFASDHGESMMDHEQWFTHGYHVYQETNKIPFMVKGINEAPGRRQDEVSLVDFVPTLLDWLQLPQLKGIDGHSFAKPHPGLIHLEGLGLGRGKQFRAVVQDQQKWVIFSEKGIEDPNQRVYFDLAADPNELNPLPWPQPAPKELLEALQKDPDPSGLPQSVQKGLRLRTPKVKPTDGLPMVAKELDPETLEKLRSLGYIE